VLRGRALEIVDDQGRTRAAFNLHPADQAASYPGEARNLGTRRAARARERCRRDLRSICLDAS
jgi:hypothetical protein